MTTNTRYSTDHGVTWGSLQAVGASMILDAGIDVMPIGDVVLAGASGYVKAATTPGGAYGNEANGSLLSAAMIGVPFHKLGSTTLENISGTQPDYVAGASGTLGGHTLWRVTPSGTLGITPSGTPTAIGPNCMAIAQASGSRYAVLMSNGGAPTLYTTTDNGANWTNRGALGTGTAYIRMRKGDTAGQQLFIADPVNGPKYSRDFGATIVTKPWTGTLGVEGIEVYG